jgi:holliday junction DNA helicase RuvA
MIGFIKGNIQYKSSNYIIAETGGVGYKIFLPGGLLFGLKAGQSLELFIHTFVREEQITLYGFQTQEELEFFELLITVSGVGPKSALGIMSLASLDMIKSAIASEDPAVFTKVAGIGKKTAERVIVELKEKIKTQAEESSSGTAQSHSDALDVLIALGYTNQEARNALKSVPQGTEDLQEKVKLALKQLNK